MEAERIESEELETGTEKMLARIEGHIGWIIFNNPRRYNAMSLDMWTAISPIMAAFEADARVRVIVLRGAEDSAFVSGADISEFEQVRSSREETFKYDALVDVATDSLLYAAKPTLAMINGWCMGGGVAIAISCDLRIASDSSRFGVPAAKLGVGYGAPGVNKLMQLVGPAHTKEIFYTGRHFSAEEALGMGLVNRLLPEGQLEGYVRDYAQTIAGNAPLTIHALHRTVEELSKDSSTRKLADADALVEACFTSEDYIEGRRAFMEKRTPVFEGK